MLKVRLISYVTQLLSQRVLGVFVCLFFVVKALLLYFLAV